MEGQIYQKEEEEREVEEEGDELDSSAVANLLLLA